MTVKWYESAFRRREHRSDPWLGNWSLRVHTPCGAAKTNKTLYKRSHMAQGCISRLCCVLSQAMVSPCKLTLRKTGGLDISLKEASSSRSVRVPPGKEMSSAFVDTYREGEELVYTTGGGGVGPGKCEFQGWARNWRQEPSGDCSPHTECILPSESLRLAPKALEPMEWGPPRSPSLLKVSFS